MRNYYCVVTFHSTYHALNFEKVIKEHGLPVRLMPIPRQVSSSCGTAAEVPCDEKDNILEICRKNHIETDEIHKIESQKENNLFLNFVNKTL